MLLKIFVPDKENKFERKSCSPLLYPFFLENLTNDERVKRYGDWVNKVAFVENLHDCDIVVPAYHLNYYYKNKNISKLHAINKTASENSKLTVCWTIGDWGITPGFKNFHLYRNGGYLSKNEGNEFCYPFFLTIDPVEKYFNNILPVYTKKTAKPVVGFCGRASDNQADKIKDIFKNLRHLILKQIGLWHEDIDMFYGSSGKRFKMLEQIKKNNDVDTNFIYHKGFIGGMNSFKNAEGVKKIFYENIKDSQYVFCYRGWGNFSLRLYETMACGRIPVIVKSDNNLPFSDIIDWNIFPVVHENEYNKIASIVAAFHAKLDDSEYTTLQLTARSLWEKYLTYSGFMKELCKKYIFNDY